MKLYGFSNFHPDSSSQIHFPDLAIRCANRFKKAVVFG
jgi:hypothetical protein